MLKDLQKKKMKERKKSIIGLLGEGSKKNVRTKRKVSKKQAFVETFKNAKQK